MIYKKTQKIRHWIVKLIAPILYEWANKYYESPRPMIRVMGAKFQDKEITGVEIGVAAGENANTILSFLNIEKIYLIDPYVGRPDMMLEVKNYLKKFGKKIVFITKNSLEAVGDIPDNLDFIYIDGNHDYEFIKDDIRLYYDKVRSGGVFGGHDFSPDYPGVIQAVEELAQEKKLKLCGEKTLDMKKSDWWVIKP